MLRWLACVVFWSGCYLPETYTPRLSGQVIDVGGQPVRGARVGVYALTRRTFHRDRAGPERLIEIRVEPDGTFHAARRKHWHWYLPAPDAMSIGWHAYVIACSSDGLRVATRSVVDRERISLVLSDGDAPDEWVEQCAKLLGHETPLSLALRQRREALAEKMIAPLDQYEVLLEALDLFYQKKGWFPLVLTELTPEYIVELPHPSGFRLVYRRQDPQTYSLVYESGADRCAIFGDARYGVFWECPQGDSRDRRRLELREHRTLDPTGGDAARP